MIHGYTTAFWWASGIFALGLVLALVIFPARLKPATTAPEVDAGVQLATD
jgi:hypothetical protein